MANIVNSQVNRLRIGVYGLTNDQYHAPGVEAPLHLWESGNIQTFTLQTFKTFVAHVETFCSDHGIENYILNTEPLFTGVGGYINMEKYIEAVPDMYKNTLFSLNYTPEELALFGQGIHQIGFVIWDNILPPMHQVSYNPNFFNPQDGIEVNPQPPPWAVPQAVPQANHVPQANQHGGRKHRRTHKKRRSLRKRASRRSKSA